MNDTTCSAPDCQRKRQARGLCSSHYSAWHRQALKYSVVCLVCKQETRVQRKGMTTCSKQCAAKLGPDARDASPKWAAHIANIEASKKPKKTAAQLAAEAEARALRSRSKLRAAYEDGDHHAFLQEVERMSTKSDSGCWIWPRVKDSYPLWRFGKADVYMHRAVVEAKHGKPLGVLAAHHACANSTCVNPEHLQPVTHRENVAEMLARSSLEARIAELEEALRGVAPGHEVLDRISTVA